jgi:formamidopyrimidine-DNA glycosylase
MPELPEVETTRRGLAPHLTGQTVARVIVREPRLRWPVPAALSRELPGGRITGVERRAKYLLLRTTGGTVILHLGMSGSLRLLPAVSPAMAHEHLDVVLADGRCLRLHDPRRFGAALWTRGDPLHHPLLAGLGPEPLGEGLSGPYLYERARGRRVAIKAFLMDSRTVAGVGNIYANEALFLAGVHPLRAAGRISPARCEALAGGIKQVLGEAIAQGGTTLRDFLASDGRPGYFQLFLRTYGRGGQPCPSCGTRIAHIRQSQRSTFYCGRCQR